MYSFQQLAAATSKNRPSNKFNTAIEIRLIELVTKCPLLYATFRNTDDSHRSRAQCWEIIAQQLGEPNITPYDCKSRWRTLRDRYKRKQKEERQGKGNEWIHFERMRIVDRRPTRKRSKELKAEGEVVIVSDSDYSVEEVSSNDSCSGPESDAEAAAVPSKKFRGYMDALPPDFDDREKKLHVLTFFQSMGETVLNLPPLLAAEAKRKIAFVISELEKKSLNADLSRISRVAAKNRRQLDDNSKKDC